MRLDTIMRAYLLSFIAGVAFLLGLGPGSALAGIHFLAIDVPADTASDVVNSKQSEIRGLIAAQASKYSGLILYHTAENLHVSLIRFNEIPTASLLNSYIALLNRDANKLPSKNIADKLREAELDVTSSGYIIYVFREPNSLTTFVTALISDLSRAKLYYQGTDFPDGGKAFPHFSVGRFDPKVVSVKRMRQILKGQVSAPVCSAFKLNAFCLKHSEEPFAQLSYSNTAVFRARPHVSTGEGDYGADEAADPTVYQLDTGDWIFQMSTNGYAPQTVTGVTCRSVSADNTAWQPVSADYDGDGLADPAVYFKDSATWCIRFSGIGYQEATLPDWFGGQNWQALAADFDGDGLADPAVYDPETGDWMARLSQEDYDVLLWPSGFGGPGWQPVAADYDGDGYADPAIYAATTGQWQLLLSRYDYELVPLNTSLGGTEWRVVAADMDGDGQADLTVQNPTNGIWLALLSSGQGEISSFVFEPEGAERKTDAADFNGDGWSDPAFCPADGLWRVWLSGQVFTLETRSQWLGGPGYVCVEGDFDGDGVADPAVYQEAAGTWSIRLSSQQFSRSDFNGFLGGPGWQALAADFDGDGRDDPAVYDSSSGRMIAALFSNGYVTVQVTLPVPGVALAADFDGDGRDDPAVYESSSGRLTAMLSGADYVLSYLSFATSVGVPAIADYDGDGLQDPALYDSSSGQFLICLSDSDYTLIAYDLGCDGGCLPAPLDYDGDGLADPVAYEPATGKWYLRLSDSNYELTTMTVVPGGVPVW